jgi:hypothetical protein
MIFKRSKEKHLTLGRRPFVEINLYCKTSPKDTPYYWLGLLFSDLESVYNGDLIKENVVFTGMFCGPVIC